MRYVDCPNLMIWFIVHIKSEQTSINRTCADIKSSKNDYFYMSTVCSTEQQCLLCFLADILMFICCIKTYLLVQVCKEWDLDYFMHLLQNSNAVSPWTAMQNALLCVSPAWFCHKENWDSGPSEATSNCRQQIRLGKYWDTETYTYIYSPVNFKTLSYRIRKSEILKINTFKTDKETI